MGYSLVGMLTEDSMIGSVKRELVRYIVEKTGIDEKTVVKVLNAEELFFVSQIEKVLGKGDGSL